jgi:hypothetical protein
VKHSRFRFPPPPPARPGPSLTPATLGLTLAVSAVLVAACGGPAKPAEGPSSTSPTNPGAGVLAPVEEGPKPPEDARLVRCGVDDGPRSVITGELSPAFKDMSPLLADGTRAKRMVAPEAVVADRAEPPPRLRMAPRAPSPPPPFTGPGAPMPTTGRRPPPPPDTGFVGPAPQKHIIVGAAYDMGGGPLSQGAIEAGQSLRPAFETCLPSSTDADSGQQDLQVTVSSSGQPLWVLPPGQAQPSPYGRCLLEQACRLKAPTTGTAHTLFLPVQTAVELPPPPPPPRPTVRVTVIMDPQQQGLADVGRSVLESAGQACASQARLLRETRFRVTLSASRGAEVASSSPDGGAPAADALVGCTAAQIQARIPPRTRGTGFSGIIRWEP